MFCTFEQMCARHLGNRLVSYSQTSFLVQTLEPYRNLERLLQRVEIPEQTFRNTRESLRQSRRFQKALSQAPQGTLTSALLGRWCLDMVPGERHALPPVQENIDNGWVLEMIFPVKIVVVVQRVELSFKPHGMNWLQGCTRISGLAWRRRNRLQRLDLVTRHGNF